MGRQPDVKSWSQHFEYVISVAEACNRNEVYFLIFGIQPETSHPLLEAYFESKAIDGLVHDVTHLNTALICWRPKISHGCVLNFGKNRFLICFPRARIFANLKLAEITDYYW
jgi:hypothetical protein